MVRASGSRSVDREVPARETDGCARRRPPDEPCAGPVHPGPNRRTDDGAGSRTVQMVTGDGNYYFDPIGLLVEAGETVTWEIQSGSHLTTAYAKGNGGASARRIPDGAEAWNSETRTEQGATFSIPSRLPVRTITSASLTSNWVWWVGSSLTNLAVPQREACRRTGRSRRARQSSAVVRSRSTNSVIDATIILE